jgi:hypothetical protein
VHNYALSYDVQNTDLTDTLELRYIRVDDGNPARDFAVDNASINGQVLSMQAYVPKPVPTCFVDPQNQIGFAAIGDIALLAVTDDEDNTDGVSDGALLFNGQSKVIGQGGAYSFDCPMTEGETLTISSYVYNPRSSYVQLKVALHNVTDDIELATTSAVAIVPANPVVNFNFNYTTQNTDEGDELEIRYIRTDDGNTARDFSVDNVSLNNTQLQIKKAPPPPNPACTMPINFNTDIALTPATSAQIIQIENIYRTLSDIHIGTNETVDFDELNIEFNEALAAYDNLNIVVSEGVIVGETISFGGAGKILKALYT